MTRERKIYDAAFKVKALELRNERLDLSDMTKYSYDPMARICHYHDNAVLQTVPTK